MMVEELLMQRSTYKALVTKSSRTLSCLIKEGDINLIKKHGVMMKVWFHSFDDVCESYLEMLTDETDITDAESYYDAVYDDYMDQLDSLNYAMDSFTMQAPAVVQRTDSNTTLSTMSPINLPKMVREQETKSPIQPVQSVVQNNETVLINTHNCTCQPLPSQQVQEDMSIELVHLSTCVHDHTAQTVINHTLTCTLTSRLNQESPYQPLQWSSSMTCLIVNHQSPYNVHLSH